MEAAHVAVLEDLYKKGWTFSHEALYNGYKYAGTVSSMRTSKGFEHCRVHTGKCVAGRGYQITIVMKRKVM